MSKWQDNDLDNILRHILANYPGQVVNAYTIARRIEDDFPDVFAELGYPIGGAGSNVQYSLAVYLSRHGRQRILDGKLAGIEHRLLKDIKEGTIVDSYSNGTPLRSSLDNPSGFRLVT